jgi:hypothetical protein
MAGEYYDRGDKSARRLNVRRLTPRICNLDRVHALAESVRHGAVEAWRKIDISLYCI